MEPLFAAYPALARTIDELCEKPPWQMTGASALVLSPSGLVLEITKPKHWQSNGGTTIVGLGAIGGSLEGEETLLACLKREAQEELQKPLEILSAEDTLIVYEGEDIRRVKAPPESTLPHPRPVLMTVSENLHRPELGQARTLAIATFWARLAQEPCLGDLYGIAILPIERAWATLAALPLTLEAFKALSQGKIITQAPLPATTEITPVWTVHSIRQALKKGAWLAPWVET